MATWDSRPALLAGLIGTGIGASLTPALHEREGAEQGLRHIYRLLDMEQLGLGVEALPESARGRGAYRLRRASTSPIPASRR